MDTRALISAHTAAWQAATRHPFLAGMRSGDLPAAALDTWLAQDYRFVERLLRFQSQLLSYAPRGDQLVLAQGLVALAEELDWFEALAQLRGIRLDIPMQPANADYTDYLQQLGQRCAARGERTAYVAAITALWAVERAYMDAWTDARPGAERYRSLVEHWTADGFAGYVAELAAAADRALTSAPPDGCNAAETAFQQVVAFERDFWQMAFVGVVDSSA